MKKVLLICLLLLACEKSSEQKVKKVNLLLDWWPNPIHIPIYAGIHEGIFEKHGITLNILKVAEAPETIPYLLSRQADLALYYMPNTIRAFATCPQIRVVARYIKEPLSGFIYRKDAGIETFYEFHQKVLGGSPDGLIEAYVSSFMKHTGIEFAAIKKMYMDFVSALVNKHVDVVTGVFWNIEGEQLKALGIDVGFIPLKTFNIPDYEELVVLSRDDVLVKEPNFKAAFQRALQESIDFSRANPEKAFTHYVKANPDKDLPVLAWERKSFEKTLPCYALSQDVEKEKWEAFQAWMVEKDLLRDKLDLNTFFLN